MGAKRNTHPGTQPQPQVFTEAPGENVRLSFLDHVRATGEPETFPGLHHGPISPDEKFWIVAPFDIDGRKRPGADKAPCPMCQPNKYLSGKLCWFSGLKAIAAIGHCCANKTNSLEAQRNYDLRVRQTIEEDFLLEHLPRVALLLSKAREAAPVAAAARTLFRKFAKASILHKALRTLLNKHGGRLFLTHNVRSEFAREAGQRSEFVARDVAFGALAGGAALRSAYDPVQELADVIRFVLHHGGCACEDAALERIVAYTPQERRQAYSDLRRGVEGLRQALGRLADFRLFFSRDNIDAVHQWASSPLQPQPGSVRLITKNGLQILEIRGAQSAGAVIDAALWTPLPPPP